MSAVLDRGALVRQCRKLEARSIRVGNKIGADWSRQWASALLDTRHPPTLYINWMSQLDAWLTRKESLS